MLANNSGKGPSGGSRQTLVKTAAPAPPPPVTHAIRQVVAAQPPAMKRAIVRAAVRNPTHPVSRAILGRRGTQELIAKSFGQVSGAARAMQSPVGQTMRLDQIQRAVAPVTKQEVLRAGNDGGFMNDIFGALSPKNFLAGTGIAAKGAKTGGSGSIGASVTPSYATLSPTSYLAVPSRAAIDVLKAGAEKPSVIPQTIKGFGENVAGMVAGTAELPIKVVSEGPGKALSQYGSQIAQDYSRRYGPLLHGNDQAFINRIKKEGAAAEVFDAFVAAGGLDATAGRAISAAGRATRALTGEENLLTRARPNLVTSGNKVRPQQLATTAGRAAAQRLEDRLRQMFAHRGELKPGENQVAPLFQSHAIRVTHSRIAQSWRRTLQENLSREVRGKPSSALAAVGRLNKYQRQAVYHAVHGIRVDTPANFRSDLMDRAALIKADRARPESLGTRIPAQYADKVDELKLIDRLVQHADKIAGPKMVAFQRGEAERAMRIEATTNLHPATAEARRLRPLGDRLGIEHPDTRAARLAASHAEYTADNLTAPRRSSGENLPPRPTLKLAPAAARSNAGAEIPRTERLAAYVRQVRAEMMKRGLPEPGYFKHIERPDVKYGDFTGGSGQRAMPADKLSSWALHRAGISWHAPEAYIQGLARSIKRPLQWRLTDEQYRAAALPTPTRAEIKAAVGENKAPHLLTGNELKRVLEHRGYDMNKVAFYNPGRLAERTLADHNLLPKGKVVGEPHDLAAQEVHSALHQEDTVQLGGHAPSDKFLTTSGWRAVPKTAHDEIVSGVKGSSLGGRLIGKLQGTAAGLILGQNPHFVIMNTLAHLFPALMGTKGTILPDLLKTPFWWHGLSNAEKDRVRMFEGGRGGHYNRTARLGSQAPHQIAAFGRRLEEQGLVQKAITLNPFRALLKAEDAQSNFFRHAVMYHEAKRMGFQNMAQDYGRAVAEWERVKHIFTLDPQQRVRAIVNDMTKLEDLGRTTVNILGDYGRFTARERQFLNNRAVLFYSFLRHVTRTLLYVLPARHPLAYGLLGELGNLHANEVRKLLGGQDLPWAYGRLFFDKKGKLSSVDLTSTSPVSSPLVDVLAGGVKDLPRLITPALAPLLDVSYGQTPTGQRVPQNVLTFLSDLFSLSYPYRTIYATHFGLRQQQADSIPFIHERPQNFKTAKSQAYMRAKQQARGPLKQYLLGTTLGLYPKPDDSRVIAQHAVQRAKKKAGSPGGYVLGSSGAGASSGSSNKPYVLGSGASGGGSGSSSGYILGSGG